MEGRKPAIASVTSSSLIHQTTGALHIPFILEPIILQSQTSKINLDPNTRQFYLLKQ
jgi:hypothetical protein